MPVTDGFECATRSCLMTDGQYQAKPLSRFMKTGKPTSNPGLSVPV
jgi:hypothetical protein